MLARQKRVLHKLLISLEAMLLKRSQAPLLQISKHSLERRKIQNHKLQLQRASLLLLCSEEQQLQIQLQHFHRSQNSLNHRVSQLVPQALLVSLPRSQQSRQLKRHQCLVLHLNKRSKNHKTNNNKISKISRKSNHRTSQSLRQTRLKSRKQKTTKHSKQNQ